MKKYIVATRPSFLAYSQAEQTVNLLKKNNPDCDFEIRKFSTRGDEKTGKPLNSFEETGIFVKELENAILEGQADFAIHSLKDVPSVLPENLILASFPKRADPRDVLLTKDNRSLYQLNDTCIIGTGSPRRILQLRLQKPDAVFCNLRGNIDTRINKLLNGEYDAIILAAAGLIRTGISIPEYSFLPVEICLPAIGQGTLTIECRKDNAEIIEMLRSINDEETETATIAERSFMKKTGGGCKLPLAAYATVSEENVNMHTLIGDHNRMKIVRLNGNAPCREAEKLGTEMAIKLKHEAKKQGIII